MNREEEKHIIVDCEIYSKIRSKYDDLDDNYQLVDFFREVLTLRDAIDEDEDGVPSVTLS